MSVSKVYFGQTNKSDILITIFVTLYFEIAVKMLNSQIINKKIYLENV